MKTRLLKILLVTVLIPLLSVANGEKGKYKKSKKINKEFSVSSDALVKISNRYGNVDITTWDKNEVVFEIEITVSGNDEDRVMEKLDQIDVEFDASSREVYAKTVINKNKSKNWFSWGSRGNLSYKINYTVKMPVDNDLTAYNDYGHIYLNELNGDASINCDYGKIVIGSLNSSNNSINTDYSKGSSIEFIKGGKINADYSGFTVAAAKEIDLNADYTRSHFENIEDLEFNCDYGSLTVDALNNINGNGDYLAMRLGKVYKNLTIDADYGSIRVGQLKDSFQSVKINSNYTGIKIGIHSDADCDITAKLSYAGLSYDDGDFTFNKKNVKSFSKYYEGYHGSRNSGSTINITSDYGGVKLFEY